jgi:uncharacterized membrane protein YebE (DUF533 family)
MCVEVSEEHTASILKAKKSRVSEWSYLSRLADRLNREGGKRR